jgi:hypothetical protein
MKSTVTIRAACAAVSFCGLLALATSQTVADPGRGSIRAAGRAAAPPREVARAPERAPVRAEAPHEESPGPAEVRHDVPDRAPPPRVEPPRAAPPPGRNWDDHDEDGRHFGGFDRGEAPQVYRGQRFHDLPARHFDIPWHDHHYFFDPTGFFYDLQPDGEYVSIQPPIGIPITALPDGADAIAVGPTTYYYLDGTFYIAQGDGFVVVAPPPGIVVPSLPDGANQVIVNGVVVYQFDGLNYAPSLQDGVTVYTVTPS